MKTTITDLYMLMGRDLEPVDEVPAGNIFGKFLNFVFTLHILMIFFFLGAGNLEQYILKSATLSTTLACPPFTEIKAMATPIMRVAVEPKYSSDLQELIKGLKLLNQADACVQVKLS